MRYLGLLLSLLGCSPPDPAPRSFPALSAEGIDHVILISLDTLRADHLGPWGGRAATPALDALGARSVVFTQATSPAPTTLAAHTSLFTGRWPHQHGVPRNGFTVPPEQELLAERLRAAGYATAAFIGAIPLSSEFGIDQGFDHYDQRFDLRKDDPLGFLWRSPELEQSQRRGDAVTGAALDWLDHEAPSDQPIFLFAHYFDAHAPYLPPDPFRPATLPDPTVQGSLDDRREVRAAHPSPEVAATAASLEALYAGEVRAVDHYVGELLRGLERRGLLERSLLVLTADHGETFTEHDEIFDHGRGVWQQTVHIPLMIQAPGLPPARRSEPVSTIDLAPTVLDLLDLPSAGMTGRSLRRALQGGLLDPAPVYSEATKPGSQEAEQGLAWRNTRKCRAVRQGWDKLIHCPLEGRSALYDLEEDPTEQRDLAAQRPQRVAELATLLQSWQSRGGSSTSRFGASEETIEALRALGYLDPG